MGWCHCGKAFAVVGKIKTMKQFLTFFIWFLALAVGLTSCELVGDIFQAGMWTSVIIIVLIVVLILWLVSKFRRRP
jgi:hypothetical protein